MSEVISQYFFSTGIFNITTGIRNNKNDWFMNILNEFFYNEKKNILNKIFFCHLCIH